MKKAIIKKTLKVQSKKPKKTFNQKTSKVIDLNKERKARKSIRALVSGLNEKKKAKKSIEASKIDLNKERKAGKNIRALMSDGGEEKKAASDKKTLGWKNRVLNLRELKQQTEEEKLILKKNLTIEQRNKIIESYLPTIESITKRISSRLPANIQYSDLISSAVIGLMDAIGKYDPSRNNKFKTYAEFRVRGAILDALRAQDWTPRSIRDKAKRIDRVTKQLEQKFSRAPNEKEIAEALNVSLEEYYSMLNQTKEVNVISIDETYIFNSDDKSSMLKILEDSAFALSQIDKKDIKKIITEAIKELPERQRIVLSLYYYEEFNLKKIGHILRVTESRVSQLHAQAISRLKYKLMSKIKKRELAAA